MKPFKITLVALALLVGGCSSTDYVGKTYPATTNVDVYFSTEDIDREYEIMGQAKTEADDVLSYESMQKKLVEDAMKRGADAILIEGLGSEVKATSTTTDGQSKDVTEFGVDSDGNIKGVESKGGYSETSTTTEIRQKVIQSKYLKYKN